MIKKLVEDLAADKIPLSTALTTTKIIAKRLGIENLSNWVSYELNGYPKNADIPNYRKFFCEIEGDVTDGFGTRNNNVILDLREISEQVGFDLYLHEEKQNIQSLEYVLQKNVGSQVYVAFPQTMVRNLPLASGYTLLSVHKKTSISHINNILIQVKQRLLDLLLEIESKYPKTEDDKPLNQEQVNVINNMITNNLYGNNNAAPISVGKTVTQTSHISITQNNIEQTLKELSELGVEKEELHELKSILEDKERAKDKPTLKRKVMSWFGKLAMKAAEKGMELELPHVLEKLNHYL